jgi:dipeptidase D
MNQSLLQLQPGMMWKYFHEITQIPRPSKKEAKIRNYLVEFGKAHQLETIVDETGNVLIRKNGTNGMEDHKIIVLQSHMDMVCEKNNDVNFDFDHDPIQTVVAGEWVKAIGTTLGADDGIGMAAALALLDSTDIVHPPLEALFTMDEETGLTGAFGLESDFLQGRILINLDSEDEGEIFIGCAGGRDTIADMLFNTKEISDKTAIKITVKGLNGGHSGDDIHKGYANANKLLNRILYKALNTLDIDLNYIDGGNLRNAIAREAYAIVWIEPSKVSIFEKYLQECESTFRKEFHVTEPHLQVEFELTTAEPIVIEKKDFYRLTQAIYACPHGVLAWSQDIPNFVETSTNLASIKIRNNAFIFTTSQRSSVASALDDACIMVAANFKNIGAQVLHTDGYPGWTPNPKSEILDISKASYEYLFKKEPLVKAIHAGLECGLIGEKYEGMDMISIGPTIKGAHSPDERIQIKTAQMFWDHLVDILKRIPKQ